MKQIVLYTSEFPYGKQETFLENEISFLSKKFDKVYIAPLFKMATVRKIEFDNVEVLTPINNSRDISIHKLVLLTHFEFYRVFLSGLVESKFSRKCVIKILKQALIIARMKKYLSKRKHLLNVDLWYFYWGTNSVNLLSFMKVSPPSCARFHGYDLYNDDERDSGCQAFQARTLSKLDRAFFISQHGENYAKSKLGLEASKCIVSRLGVPDKGVCSASQDGVFRVLTCSNIYEVKRLDLVAKALSHIDSFAVEWTHIGDGKKKLLQEVKEIVSHSNVDFIFKGRVSNKEVVDYYLENPVDLFLNTSSSEGVPVSIMEALSFGVPVIATDVGGTSEILTSPAGELIAKDFETDDLSRLIENFQNDSSAVTAKRAAARKGWETFAKLDTNYSAFTFELGEILSDPTPVMNDRNPEETRHHNSIVENKFFDKSVKNNSR